MAEEIVLNAKLQRPSVCNAIESLLIHEKWYEKYGISILKKLHEQNVEIFAEERIVHDFPQAKLASESDWGTEFLRLALSVKLVSNVEEAINHINTYGTHHSETIITEDKENKNIFLQTVDSAAVYHNASTRFTDGFELGYGAEIGISTQKLHARGPMGLEALTSSKFVIKGSGQVRT